MKDHNIILLNYRSVRCSCQWHKEIAEKDWGIAAAKDRLLDYHAEHVKRIEEIGRLK